MHASSLSVIYPQLYFPILNWAHRYLDKHTTHKIDHTIYSVIEEWNSAEMAAIVNAFINKKGN